MDKIPRFPKSSRRTGKILLLWLILFSFLDMCTTAVCLVSGYRELNPVVSFCMLLAGFKGLLLCKLAGVALGVYFLSSGRLRLLRRATVVSGLVVGWNAFLLAGMK